MRWLLAGFLLSGVALTQQQLRAVVPAQASASANRFYSPGVDAGDYVYISGQSPLPAREQQDRKSTRLNSSHVSNSYAVFCLKKKTHKYSIFLFIKITINGGFTLPIACSSVAT